jgi:hypothetical protein
LSPLPPVRGDDLPVVPVDDDAMVLSEYHTTTSSGVWRDGSESTEIGTLTDYGITTSLGFRQFYEFLLQVDWAPFLTYSLIGDEGIL